MADIYKSAGIIIRNKKLLITRTKGKPHFFSPGGKIESGETPAQSLVRELKEELDITCTQDDLIAFGTFKADAIDQAGKTIEIVVFMVEDYRGEPVASSEIEELKWISTADVPTTPLGTIFAHKVMPKLKEQGLID